MSDQQKRDRLLNLTNAGKGRPKGVPNKTTKLAKEAIAQAFDELGGTQGLVDWATSDPDNTQVFYATIWPKIIPVQTELTGANGGPIQTQALDTSALSEAALREIAAVQGGS